MSMPFLARAPGGSAEQAPRPLVLTPLHVAHSTTYWREATGRKHLGKPAMETSFPIRSLKENSPQKKKAIFPIVSLPRGFLCMV